MGEFIPDRMDKATWEDTVSKVRNNDSSLTEFECTNRSLSLDEVRQLTEALRSNSTLRIVNLSGTELSNEAMAMLSTAILESSTLPLEILDLSDNLITDENSALCESLQAKKIALILNNNPCGPDAPGKKKKSRRDKDKDKSSKKTRRKSKKEKSPRTKLEEGSTKVKVLQGRISALETKEQEYQQHIEELEERVKGLTRTGTFSRISSSSLFSLPSSRCSKTVMTVSTKSIIVTRRIAAGGGSSAEVYTCIVDGWLVVMKQLSTEGMGQDKIEAFSRKVRMLELLPPHENIVRYLFHDAKENAIRLFITHYDASLGSYIRQMDSNNEPVPLKIIYRVLLDIIKGVEFLHHHNIMHRDLKSDNIFILYGDRKEIKHCAIGDFDTAKQEANTKTVLGTPAWMAPEVMTAAGSDGYSFPCDVYGFGMIIYELITRKMPFHDVNTMRVAMLVMQGQSPALPEDIDPSYEKLVTLHKQCISFKPEERPAPAKIKSIVALALANL